VLEVNEAFQRGSANESVQAGSLGFMKQTGLILLCAFLQNIRNPQLGRLKIGLGSLHRRKRTEHPVETELERVSQRADGGG
jgi:hypothetical protein